MTCEIFELGELAEAVQDIAVSARAVISLRLELARLGAVAEIDTGLWRSLTKAQREAEGFYLALHGYIQAQALESLR